MVVISDSSVLPVAQAIILVQLSLTLLCSLCPVLLGRLRR